MNKLLVSLVLSLGMAGSAYAQEILVGDAEAGAGKVAICAACHGPDGNSLSADFPKIAGLGEKYLYKQLNDIKAGDRVVIEMTGMLNNLDEQDLRDIAAFYDGQTHAPGVANDAELVARGEQIYRGGDLATGLPACTGCHSPTGKGNDPAGYPLLSGQHAKYIATQLTSFREGERANDGESMVMRTIASRLSNKDIEAVSAYIQGLR
ncbi:c-type cytochrome [Halopseudomonas pelagia]|uniref:c-type cytochrome n=1 Tax=Halopseudomonas pelagia TaxID=553151 RepID=UPI00039B8EF5|nr:c-type cytochrome [Halopseudomonas pelagia]|tara:strand:+ start:1017 stop:1637 length:621 start_codon:yes stop_codon:yes gene_type:complete